MVSEDIQLDDLQPLKSSVKFGNSGRLKDAHVGKLITDTVILSDFQRENWSTKDYYKYTTRN